MGDYVFHMNGGTIMSDDGMTINARGPVMTSESPVIGGRTTTSFAIPASLALLGGFRKEKLDRKIINDDEIVKDDIYDKLLKMVEVPTKDSVRQTRGMRKEKTNKTRKN